MRRFSLVSTFALLLVAGCTSSERPSGATYTPPAALTGTQAEAVFAGGCFWCMEPSFEKLDGVVSVTSGFAGGREPNPTYEQVSNRQTGHAEAVRVVYDSTVVSYARLLEVFWHNIDPFAAGRQFCDVGPQYRSAIFYGNARERSLAEAEKTRLASEFGQPVQTEIVAETPFYPAEDYHQDFYKKSPDRYYSYRRGCGRDARLEQLWGASAGH